MKYFTMHELTRSDTASRHGIDNKPGIKETVCLQQLVDILLDPIRAAWGRPIVVNSGYRCPELNRLVGGAANSQHTKGQAADIECLTRNPDDNRRLFQLIRNMNLPFDQLINEFGYSWIHISYVPGGRHRVLEAEKVAGKTVYTVMQ